MCFCHPRLHCHPAVPARGEGDVGVGSSVGFTQPPSVGAWGESALPLPPWGAQRLPPVE